MKNVETKKQKEERGKKEIISWDYKTAWKFFTENAYKRCIPETETYVLSLPTSRLLDLRDNPRSSEILLDSIKPSTFIIIDGASANGKTTAAYRLAKKVDAIVVDIDLLCKEFIDNNLRQAKSKLEIVKILSNAHSITDEYILNNIEKIIYQKSLSKKPVILVGFYIEVIYRAILARTLGKYFENVVSIICCEKNFKQVENFIKKRAKEYGSGVPGQNEIEMCFIQWEQTNNLINQERGRLLGFGMNYSFVVDSKVVDRLK